MASENVHQLLEKPLKERKRTFKSPRIPQLKIIQSRQKSSDSKHNIKRRNILQFPVRGNCENVDVFVWKCLKYLGS